MKMYLAIMKDTQGVPDFFHPTELMGQNPQQVKQILSEDTPVQYIQGVYSPEDYLKIIQSPNFIKTIASYNPSMPEPAMKKLIANLTDYVQSYIIPSQNEENFDIQDVQEPSVIYPSFPPQVKDPKTGEFKVAPGYAPLNAKGNNNTVQVFHAPEQSETKYFTESGIKFKLENGELYKKEWTDTPIEPYMDKVTDPKTGEEKEVEIIPDFRLISKDTRKPVKNSKVILQQAIWKKLEN